jgi:thiol:disulfide interchange protein DsbA
MSVRAFITLAALLLVSTANAELREGKDFKVLPRAQTTEHPGKIEVLEFFSWGCPHCNHMYPYLTKWAATLPANVVLVKVPSALGRREWGTLSRAFYALQSLGELERLDGAVFDAIHKDGVRLVDEESITAWLGQHGVAADAFKQAFNSPAVSQKVLRAEQLARDYGVSSVPTLTVNGRYIVTAEEAHDFNEVLAIAKQVIAKAAEKK